MLIPLSQGCVNLFWRVGFWEVGTERGRESGTVSLSRPNLQLCSRFSRFDLDFSIAPVRGEIRGFIGNSVPAAQLLAYFDESVRYVVGAAGTEQSPAGLLCQSSEI